MYRQIEKVFLVGQPDQQRTHHRSGAEVHRAEALGVHDRGGLLLARVLSGDGPQVVNGERQRPGWVDDLAGVAVRVAGEAGAQHLVPAHQLRQRRAQRRDVQRAADAQSHGDQVLGPAGLQLVQEPQSVLRERQRQRTSVPGRAGDDRSVVRSPGRHQGVHGVRRALGIEVGRLEQPVGPQQSFLREERRHPRTVNGSGSVSAPNSEPNSSAIRRAISAACGRVPPSRKNSSSAPVTSAPSTAFHTVAMRASAGEKPPCSALWPEAAAIIGFVVMCPPVPRHRPFAKTLGNSAESDARRAIWRR